MEGPDRDFFINIKRAITSNPFSRERTEVDRELAGVSGKDRQPSDVFAKLLTRVTEKLREYESAYSKRPPSSESDLELYRNGKLFEMFHRYMFQFDNLIVDQIKLGDETCNVSFAADILRELHEAGFERVEAKRYLALFYQMRRAFFFIGKIAGQSQCVQDLRKSLWNNIFTGDLELYDSYLWNRMEDFSTMLLGETGTGKGLASSAIGRSGYIPFDEKQSCFQESFAKSYISINLSQYQMQLIESELFGHKKGAFTGAIESHEGIFARCSPHGAIFIDEIGDVSIPIQIKLLQVLQERTFTPVGSRKAQKFKGRVIAATNQPLSQLRKDGKFREDFYYRLCSDVIEVPPLRRRLDENPDELLLILSFIVERIVGKSSSPLVEQVGDVIQKQAPKDYEWPGNIRELEQCVRQILLNGHYRWQKTDARADDHGAREYIEGTLTAGSLLSQYCGMLYEKHGSYEAVARITDLDRRTVKKYVVQNNG